MVAIVVYMHALDQMTKLRKNKEQDEKSYRESLPSRKKKSVRTRSAVVGSLPMFEIFLDVS
jgi:hypothetical protein